MGISYNENILTLRWELRYEFASHNDWKYDWACRVLGENCNPYNSEIFLHKPCWLNFFFQFEIIINVSVGSFRFIWIPMLWVYSHYTYFTLSVRGSNLDARIWRLFDVRFRHPKTILMLKGLTECIHFQAILTTNENHKGIKFWRWPFYINRHIFLHFMLEFEKFQWMQHKVKK